MKKKNPAKKKKQTIYYGPECDEIYRGDVKKVRKIGKGEMISENKRINEQLRAELEECRTQRDEAIIICGNNSPFIRALQDRAERAEQQLEEAHGTIERVFCAVQRYESYHDRDPKRVDLWREVKLAFVVPGEEKK